MDRQRRGPWLSTTLVLLLTTTSTTALPAEPSDEESSPVDTFAPHTWPAGRVIRSESDGERRIREALDRPVEVQFLDQPLSEVVHALAEKCDILVALDDEALAADGKGAETPISVQRRKQPLHHTLSRMLDGQGLAYVVGDGALLITTRTAASQPGTLSTRVYQVHDLVVGANDPLARVPGFDGLISARRLAALNDGYAKEFIGPGLLVLVVTDSEVGHRRFEELLKILRSARQPDIAALQAKLPLSRIRLTSPGSPGGGMGWSSTTELLSALPSQTDEPPLALPAPRIIDGSTDEERRIRTVLEQPTMLQFRGTRLEDVAALIEMRASIPVSLDLEALAADGKGPDFPVTLDFREGSWDAALRRMLAPQALTYVVWNDELLLTTRTFASSPERARFRVYEVHDLVIAPNDRAGRFPDFDSLIEILTSVIPFQDWYDNGGSISHMTPVTSPGMYALATWLNDSDHHEMERLLKMLRDARVPEVLAAQAKQPSYVEPPPASDTPNSVTKPEANPAAGDPATPASARGGGFF